MEVELRICFGRVKCEIAIAHWRCQVSSRIYEAGILGARSGMEIGIWESSTHNWFLKPWEEIRSPREEV